MSLARKLPDAHAVSSLPAPDAVDAGMLLEQVARLAPAATRFPSSPRGRVEPQRLDLES